MDRMARTVEMIEMPMATATADVLNGLLPIVTLKGQRTHGKWASTFLIADREQKVESPAGA